MKKLIQSLVVAGVMASAGGIAFAQSEPPMQHDGWAHRDPAKMEQMRAKHLAELKAKLKITASQETAWTAFTDSMKPPAGMMEKRPDPAELDKLTTPERIDKMQAMHKEHEAARDAAMAKRGDATKAFYAALNPDQQKVFDAEFAKMMHHGAHKPGDHGKPPAQAPAKP